MTLRFRGVLGADPLRRAPPRTAKTSNREGYICVTPGAVFEVEHAVGAQLPAGRRDSAPDDTP